MSSASEILTRAADLIRDTAASAFPGPWVSGERCIWNPDDSLDAVCDDGCEGDGGMINAETAKWVALMSPAVAQSIEALLRVAAVEEANPSPLEYGSATIGGFMTVARELTRQVLDIKEDSHG